MKLKSVIQYAWQKYGIKGGEETITIAGGGIPR